VSNGRIRNCSRFLSQEKRWRPSHILIAPIGDERHDLGDRHRATLRVYNYGFDFFRTVRTATPQEHSDSRRQTGRKVTNQHMTQSFRSSLPSPTARPADPVKSSGYAVKVIIVTIDAHANKVFAHEHREKSPCRAFGQLDVPNCARYVCS